MAVLKHKTRGMVTPQGKQKVYFCCHPADFALYFDKISDEILKKQNCAVWYLESFDTDYDEQFFSYLKEMQLFVVPVTTNFLFSENHALSVEFKFAIENHIPVLPLMQESGLEEIFNQKCGDLQFLDKNVTDLTAISYDEKLEKYLSSVLIGDELAEKIRAAFDAYVFLSYRKKDRKYAQELMRLIHKNDFCRDIAIWYDEFLTPGENFNNSIKEALGKSELFVLAVTPNLVNEINYVMTEEYPKAKELGKVILPAELVATDKKELSEKYEDIPTPVDAHKDNELTEALLEAVKKIAIKENDKSPTHNFFIGLAYLGGVDVEVDHERALSLITSSAEAGLLEAMTKLVEMYRNGTGVECSYITAIEWQKKIIEYHQARYEKKPDEYNTHTLICSIIACGDYFDELGSLTNAEENYLLANNLMESISIELKSSIVLKYDLSVSYDRLGNIYIDKGDFEKASDYYDKAFEIDFYLYEETGGAEPLHGIVLGFNKFGNIYQSKGNFERARKYYEKAVDLSVFISEKTNINEVREYLPSVYGNIAHTYELEGNVEKSREYYGKALEISLALVKETNTVRVRSDLSTTYRSLGGIYKSESDFKKAKEYYEKALEIDIALVKDTNRFDLSCRLLISYKKMGDVYIAEGNTKKAKEYYDSTLEMIVTLVKDNDRVDLKEEMSIIYMKIGDIYKLEGDIEKMVKYYEKALGIELVIAKKINTLEARRNLSISYNKIGDIYFDERYFEIAREFYENALEIRLGLIEESKTFKARSDLAVSYNRVGNAYELQDNIEKARECYEKALEINIALTEETNEVEIYDSLAYTYYNLFKLSNETELKYLFKAIQIYIMLSDKCPDVKRYENILNDLTSYLI